MIRLLCVEDDPLMRIYLATRLAAEPDLQLVGTVADVEAATAYCRRGEVDVLLLDWQLKGTPGVQLLQKLCPWARWCFAAEGRPAVLICTGLADEALRAKARLLGARGVLEKSRLASDLLPAIRAVAEGSWWLSAGPTCPPDKKQGKDRR